MKLDCQTQLENPAPMASEFRRVGRHTLVYGGGMMLGKLASFLMLPVYTRYLTPADYGVLELLGMTIDVIGMIAGAGLAGGLFKFYSGMDSAAAKRTVMGTVAFGGMGLALFTAGLGMLFAEPLNALIFQDGGNPNYLRVFFLAYFLQAAGSPGLLLLRIQERSGVFIGVGLAKLVASLSLNIYFVVFRGLGLEGVLASMVLVSAVTAVGMALYTWRYTGFSFSWARFREMTRFGAPLIVVSLGSFMLTFSDRYFLNFFAGTAAVGVYSLAYRFTFVLSALAVAPFQQAWGPRQFEVAKRADAGDVFRRMFFYLTLGLVGGAAMMVAVIEPVVRVMAAPAFHGAARLVPVILVATVLQQWATYSTVGLYLKDRPGMMARATLVAVVVILALNILLIPKWGAMGAAWATVAAYIVRFAIVYRASQAVYRIEYPWRRVSGVAAIAVGVYAVRELAGPESLLVSLTLSAVLVIATAAGCYGLLDRAERSVVRTVLGRVIHPSARVASPVPGT
jgi:O-antigen/teichoic acid export membrane protein